MTDKYFTLVLHSHIPFVLAHGSWPHGMDWLFEAAAESYLPLLDVFCRLRDEGIPPRVSISFTPVLADQLKRQSFRDGFAAYLKMKREIARTDRLHFEKTGNKSLASLAIFWEDWYEKLSRNFSDKFKSDLISGFKSLQDEGSIEILTSAATHGYFPLLGDDESLSAQVRQGKHVHRSFFGKEAKGFWLPECGYRPAYEWKPPVGQKEAYSRRGVDEILGSEGISYFFIDAHLLRGGEAKGVYMERFPALGLLWDKFQKTYQPEKTMPRSSYLPYLAYPSDVPFLARDEVTGSQVWSRQAGYPGDGWYLEFHKKHFPGGMRYWRITSSAVDLAEKSPYQPEKVKERLEENASHFVSLIHQSLKEKEEGVIASLYDTELFGHWWFEGPEWLYLVLKKLKGTAVQSLTAAASLERLAPQTRLSLPEGSWGEGGFHWIWLNEDTSWIWEKIYAIEDVSSRLEKLPWPKNKRVLRQFYREKFLLESSDWPFLISTWTARDYAESRVAEHYLRSKTLGLWLRAPAPLTEEQKELLSLWEQEDLLFDTIETSDGTII